jgi:FKBP-type peptidyl-prolyl cis-trans isomerase FklB
MKNKGLFVLTIVIAIMLSSCAKNAVQSTKMKSNIDSVSYAFGIFYYGALNNDSLGPDLNLILIAKAMLDVNENKSAIAEEEARTLIMTFMNKREVEKKAKQAEIDKVTYKDYIDQNAAFLAKNKEREGVIVTPSGLQYEVIKMGTGALPTGESTVKVHYVGTLIDGTEFDSSIKRNQPAEFPVSGIIPGWTEALQLMPVGSKFKIYLPDSIAYGATGYGTQIRPYSTLIFEVELLDILK